MSPPANPAHERGDGRTPLPSRKGNLPRLAEGHYRAGAFVHWTLTVEQRRTGWLTPSFHVAWRELLLHACARYLLVCPVYVLMPDHAHVLLCGYPKSRDQRLAVGFLRRHLAPALRPHVWQKQAHDHVLREEERAHDGFTTITHYIIHNPVRAGLVLSPDQWRYSGCCIPGYPELTLMAPDFWLRFWRLYASLCRQAENPRAE